MLNIRRILSSLALLLALAGLGLPAIADDKFAIAADGDQPAAAIARLAGIAPFFHLYDSTGNLLEVLPNPHLDLEYGIGPAAAGTLADMGVTVLVARRIPGPKMEEVLLERNVRIVRRLGTVQEVVDELKE
jgi:predicted Fe-Mo cluster-binding NifX family protein